ncbi:MAG: HEAT repeat domain-containing protein [bacterium]
MKKIRLIFFIGNLLLISGYAGSPAKASESSKEVLADLKKILKSTNPAERRNAVEQLGRINGDVSVKLIIPRLRDENEYVRSTSINSLYRLKAADKIFDDICRMLKNDSMYDVRRTAAKTLGKLNDQKAIPFLIDALKDLHPDVQISAAVSLERLNAQEAGVPLLALLKERDPRVKRQAILSLSTLRNDESVQYIEQELNSDDVSLREAACKTLGNLNSSKSILKIKPLLQDKHEEVKIAAAEALARMQDVSGLDVCLKSLHSKDDSIKMRAIEVFGLIGSREHISELEKYVSDEKFKSSAQLSIDRINDRFPRKKNKQ